MKLMFREQVVPRLHQEGFVKRVIVHRKINLFGKGEADIESQALDLTARGREPEVGITAHDATISFRISASAETEEQARDLIEPTAKLIYERFGSLILGEGSVDVPDALMTELLRTGATLSTAESCTGGLVAHMITALPGVSPYYPGGVVSYANEAKMALLDVPGSLIEAHGAVSSEVAAAMAEGVRKRFGADLGLSTTGVAGPTGGTSEKPVGLVYLGISTPLGTQTRRIDIGADQPRAIIQHRASKAAINWARLTLIRER
jgi:nicotinamide-nucleotide amidase